MSNEGPPESPEVRGRSRYEPRMTCEYCRYTDDDMLTNALAQDPDSLLELKNILEEEAGVTLMLSELPRHLDECVSIAELPESLNTLGG